MIAITNAKVGGFSPLWASFRGFSLLFNNPGEALKRDGEEDGNVLRLCNTITPIKMRLYKELAEALRQVGGQLLTVIHLFCPLPPCSYHVTVLDGVNDDNLSKVNAQHHSALSACLLSLPHSLRPLLSCLGPITSHPLLSTREPIKLQFDKLDIWGNQVLVACLAPTLDSVDSFNVLQTERTELADILQTYGIESFKLYSPHVSLGYFANQECGQHAMASLRHWTHQFRSIMQHTTITFDSVALYGFTDMASYFR